MSRVNGHDPGRFPGRPDYIPSRNIGGGKKRGPGIGPWLLLLAALAVTIIGVALVVKR